MVKWKPGVRDHPFLNGTNKKKLRIGICKHDLKPANQIIKIYPNHRKSTIQKPTLSIGNLIFRFCNLHKLSRVLTIIIYQFIKNMK